MGIKWAFDYTWKFIVESGGIFLGHWIVRDTIKFHAYNINFNINKFNINKNINTLVFSRYQGISKSYIKKINFTSVTRFNNRIIIIISVDYSWNDNALPILHHHDDVNISPAISVDIVKITIVHNMVQYSSHSYRIGAHWYFTHSSWFKSTLFPTQFSSYLLEEIIIFHCMHPIFSHSETIIRRRLRKSAKRSMFFPTLDSAPSIFHHSTAFGI